MGKNRIWINPSDKDEGRGPFQYSVQVERPRFAFS